MMGRETLYILLTYLNEMGRELKSDEPELVGLLRAVPDERLRPDPCDRRRLRKRRQDFFFSVISVDGFG